MLAHLTPRLRQLLIAFGIAFALSSGSTAAHAQTICANTPDGQVCTTQQAIVNGTVVAADMQRSLGLVVVESQIGTCGATLLNRFWVLTADHCVRTAPLDMNSPTVPLSSIHVVADWFPVTGYLAGGPQATSIVRFGPADGADFALIYLGEGDLGPARDQPIYDKQVAVGDVLTKFGIGFYTYANAGPPPIAASYDHTYRGGAFGVPDVPGSKMYLVAPYSAPVGVMGGDSGGPDWVSTNGAFVALAGVTSFCGDNTYVPGAPRDWVWATSSGGCGSYALAPFRDRILQIINAPPCPNVADACSVAETTSLLQ